MTEILRDALNQALADQSLRAVARGAGVPQPSLTRFLHGSSLRLDVAEKVAAFLGLELRPRRAGQRKGRGRAKE
jgi:hypothetical protein